jgi:hypothetical protein
MMIRKYHVIDDDNKNKHFISTVLFETYIYFIYNVTIDNEKQLFVHTYNKYKQQASTGTIVRFLRTACQINIFFNI